MRKVKVNLDSAKDHLEGLVNQGVEKAASRPFRLKIEELCVQLQSLSDLDLRSAEEILGYDEKGMF